MNAGFSVSLNGSSLIRKQTNKLILLKFIKKSLFLTKIFGKYIGFHFLLFKCNFEYYLKSYLKTQSQ